ncbi:HmuY family protein [Tannerella sp.]|uniref:HmuY family protein n=1 Tax=Tannerella sp. TaxID=2382127 RepID=UPI0026DD6658|nr:HmuY family protein [Tannerella sp.]MDO4704446.1 HmuY family protein [Tannerella sp.]
MKKRSVMMMALVALGLAFVGCDKKDDVKKETVKKALTIDATKYDMWTYINLETGQTEIHRDFSEWNYYKVEGTGKDRKRIKYKTTPAQGSEADIKIKWHIAIHRYDIKTNNGEAVATAEKNISNVKTLPATGYEADKIIENKIITDPSEMTSYKVGYASKSNLNKVLEGWLIKTPTGTMPPYSYKLSELVYVVKFKDGSHAKLKFTDHLSAVGETGHVTFQYEFQPK